MIYFMLKKYTLNCLWLHICSKSMNTCLRMTLHFRIVITSLNDWKVGGMTVSVIFLLFKTLKGMWQNTRICWSWLMVTWVFMVLLLLWVFGNTAKDFLKLVNLCVNILWTQVLRNVSKYNLFVPPAYCKKFVAAYKNEEVDSTGGVKDLKKNVKKLLARYLGLSRISKSSVPFLPERCRF